MFNIWLVEGLRDSFFLYWSTWLPVHKVAFRRLSWEESMKEVQGINRDNNVEVAKQLCMEMVVFSYVIIYKEYQGFEGNNMTTARS